MGSALNISRRGLLRRSLMATGALTLAGRSALAQQGAPAIVTRRRPGLPYGVQAGDLRDGRAILWARADRPARMMVDVATTESMRNARTVGGPFALEDSDFTAKL
ncbi:MAG TPA: PhoD-like phosphatase N-terminal domain-containing protein, partial [Geminicoccaceae bacterium]